MNDRLLSFLNKYKYHFLVWSIYTVYELAVVMMLTGKGTTLDIFIFYNTLNISLFYAHLSILKYTLDDRDNIYKLRLLFLILLELALYIGIKIGCELLFYNDFQDYASWLKLSDKLIKSLYRSIYFIGYGTGYYFLTRSWRQTQLLEEMEQQHFKNLIQQKEIKNELVLTQNAFLKSQISPEFLIDTLAYLHEETQETAPKAAENIVSLSAIMQYALSEEALAGFVKLEKEIELIENYLFLHQARQVNQAQLKLSYSPEALSTPFIPLVLMTLTENILKHGLLNDPDNPAEIKITCSNSILRIETANQKSNNNSSPSHGIGLKNIKDRLSMTYGGTASFAYYLDAKRYFHTAIEVRL
ncbi:sensor histidine kinase [Pedobacter cryoconitis]|uniref:Histidine kinase n=1 Tax=Pedobacter cryoconitis TaxID=188932 RepID=A0A327SZJ1_9SPHI|nr:histidine kinase [Pedobacter cryoconitis]RAJ34411.1 histidine kinase [Pedobacter cryoconitis]